MKSYHKNPRQISRKQFEQLETWLRELGDLSGIVHDLNSGEIIGGNQRSQVFNIDKCKIEYTSQSDQPDEQGTVAHGFIVWEGKRYAYREVRWSDRQCEQANIVANKAGGSWDFDTLANEFEFADLLEWGFNEKELIGLDFGEEEAKEDAGAQVDKAEELREKWQTATGQLWQLGKHRLICGDCTDKAVVDRLMGGEKAGALLNDPPYGMRLDADFSGMVNHLDFAKEKGVKGGSKYADVIGDDSDYDASPIMQLFDDVKEQFWFGADYYSLTLGDTMHEGAWLVWDKRLDESADKMYGSCFELLWSRQKHKRDVLRHKWAGIFGTEKEPTRGRMHPNQKPVELYEDILTRYTDNGALIVDCYAGSGTTIISCGRTGRIARACEISPAYVAVALQRYLDTTGDTPILIESEK